MALDALGAQTIRECTLLEARCSLPGITGLEQSYEGRLDELIYDGQNLGFILQEQDQGRKDFLQTYLWALEYEHCTTLPAALEVVQNLDRYQIVRTDSLEEYALSELGKPTGFVRQEVADCFELERYGRDLLQHRGYTLTEDGGAYIAKQRQQTQAPVRISLL